MCIQDFTEGRKINGVFRIAAVAGTPTLIVPADKNRITLNIAAAGNSTVALGPDSSVTVAAGYGLTLPGHDFSLDARKHGDLVTKEVWAIGSAATACGIVESFLYGR
jgi:hypothetical protein